MPSPRNRYAAQPVRLEESEPAATETASAWARSLQAVYETDPEVIAAVLPRPLEPTDEPLVHVNVSAVEMDSGLSFGAGSVSVRAKHRDTVGQYALTMPMGAEAAVVGGREMYGEPKKLAEIELRREGDEVIGSVCRHGITYLELRGRVEAEIETPPPSTSLDYYVKFLISPDGKGFDDDPALVYCYRETTTRRAERVAGEVILRESPVDPVADLPLRRLLGMTLSERQSLQRGVIVDRLPGEWIAPFVHQRYDLNPLRRRVEA